MTFAVRPLRLLLLASLSLPLQALGEDELDPSVSLQAMSLAQLERQREIVEHQLNILAQPSMRSGVGAVGFRSETFEGPDNPVWILIQLAEQVPIDQVVLVPTIWRDSKTGFRADGFPLEFRILAGNDEMPEGKLLAQYGPEDRLLPRAAPVVIDVPPTMASWVRLEATKLTPRAWDEQYLLQLSEIMVFSESENVALRQPIQVSSSDWRQSGPRHARYLVDGFVPYLMDAYGGRQSRAFASNVNPADDLSLSIDLQSSQPLNRIHLHATDLSDTVPQAAPEDFGFPRQMIVEGANQADFSDAAVLIEYRHQSLWDCGPIMMRRFPETDCRYVRLTVLEPYTHITEFATNTRIGFAEIELFSQGQNVALGKPVRTSFKVFGLHREIVSLTDGNNLFGQILPIKQWMNELAQRHDLETMRPAIAAELAHRYADQKANNARLVWLAAVLGFVAVCTVLVERILRQRAIHRTRERIAADLHDELGGNLHAIGLLADVAQANFDSPEKLKDLLVRMRALSERTGNAARQCTNLLESKGMFENLMLDMQRTSTRLMADLEHEILIDGEEYLQQLPSRSRIDLFLFYNECLVNVLRHSGATCVTTQLEARPDQVFLSVTDDGCGLATANIDGVPPSLHRRAKLLGGHVTAKTLNGKGTCIELRLRTRGIWRRLRNVQR